MDKKELQTKILEATYNHEKWLDVLRKYFGASKLWDTPKLIRFDNNDWNTLVEEAYELGNFYTADERLVGVYRLNLTPNAWIEKNRVGLRGLLKRIYKQDVDAALIVFVQNDKWRFSYVSEIRTEEGKKETEPKRYTYLFGQGESCRTAAERFDKLKGKPILLNDLFDAFSVEKLNKDFFKTYKDYFELFSEHLAKESRYRMYLLGASNELEKGWKDEKAKPIRDFVKKLLGRLVFLQFLQKKGWMGVPSHHKNWEGGNTKFLKNLFETYPDLSSFHSKALKTLFFETLNTKRKNDIASKEIGANIKIPYLNGGLFDTDVSFERSIDFPIEYFKNLLAFFESYNFTIDENDPYDNEVGIDPEMLGHIFENLLEENKDKGAFYTPKEIVHYMCQESLKEYLFTQLPDENKEEIEAFVCRNEISKSFTDFKKANEINEKLKNVKVCDPAIGSGAFPMGLLKEIFECRRLLYPYLKTNKVFDPAKVKKEIIQQNIYGVDVENGAVEIARLRFWLALVVDENEPQPLPNLDFKIMQGNSLLESFADIDLSNLINADDDIIAEQKTQLSLGDEFDTKPQQLTVFTKANKDTLYLLIKKYFDPDEWEKQTGEKVDKAVVKKEINEFVESKIHVHILNQQRTLQEDISALEKKWKEAGANDFGKLNQKSKEYKGYLKWKEQLEHLAETEEKLISLQKTEDKTYFLWHLWFKDVFDKGGFDIMIGNPPYIQLQKMTIDVDLFQQANYETFTRSGDIYCLFYEQGNKLLKSQGTLCYITSNNWMRTKYGELLRKYFVDKTNPIKLLNFEDTKIFQTATVETNIFISNKEINRNNLEAVAVKTDYKIGDSIENYFKSNNILIDQLSSDDWVILSKPDFEVKNIIEQVGVRLKEFEDVTMNYGIKTGLNEAFYIDEKLMKEFIKNEPQSKNFIKPVLRGREIKRYTTVKGDNYLLFIPWHFPLHNDETITGVSKEAEKKFEKEYPVIYSHLKSFKDKLSKRNQAETGVRYEWYALQRSAATYYREFEKEKIVWLVLSDKPQFAIDTNHYYMNDSTFFMQGNNLKYLCAILNSKVSEWYFDKIATSSGMGTTMWKKYKVEKLPIPKIENERVIKKIEILVNYLIYLNNEDKQPVNPHTSNVSIVSVFEDILNMMVYELYFEEHMKKEKIDILNFVDEKTFPPLTKNDKENLEIIGSCYKWLLEKENQIRQRIILSNIRSTNIIARINSTTH